YFVENKPEDWKEIDFLLWINKNRENLITGNTSRDRQTKWHNYFHDLLDAIIFRCKDLIKNKADDEFIKFAMHSATNLNKHRVGLQDNLLAVCLSERYGISGWSAVLENDFEGCPRMVGTPYNTGKKSTFQNAGEFNYSEGLSGTSELKCGTEVNSIVNEFTQMKQFITGRVDSSPQPNPTPKRAQTKKSLTQESLSSEESNPSPRSSPNLQLTLQPLSPFHTTSILLSDDDEPDLTLSISGIVPLDCPVIINDVEGLQLGPPPRQESRWLINEINVSEKWHQFKEKSLKLATERGLFVESHTQEILSLSHILLLKPKQHCPLMVEVFGAELLEVMHKDMLQRFTEQETEIDIEIFMKLTQIVKQLQQGKVTRDIAVTELQTLMINRSYGEISILKAIKNIIEKVPRNTLKSLVGEVELCTTYIDPVLSPIIADPDRDIFLRWSNKEAPESKARKLMGRAKQPDAIINNIDQLSWGSSRGH
ncbi:210_t:CDS:2, partial [Paraglomus brasilianum]